MAINVPNVSMSVGGAGPDESSRRPIDVRPLMLSMIEVGKRERPLDPATVERLGESISAQGLLQPIGVQKKGSGDGYRLMYGAHRLAAMTKLNEDRIACVIYSPDMQPWEYRFAEIAENLCRKELTPQEREAHTTIYLGLLKKHGGVIEADEARKHNARNQHSEAEGHPNHLGHPPTATRRAASELGISDETVRNRVRNTVNAAARNGVVINGKATPEAMSADELATVGEAALKEAKADRAKAVINAKPRAPTKLNPSAAKSKPRVIRSEAMGPVERCSMAVRALILEFFDGMKPDEFAPLIADLRDQIDELEKIAERRKQNADQPDKHGERHGEWPNQRPEPPRGTVAWIVLKRAELRSALQDVRLHHDIANGLYQKIRKSDAWRLLEDMKGRPFRSFEAFCRDANGIGMPCEVIEKTLVQWPQSRQPNER